MHRAYRCDVSSRDHNDMHATYTAQQQEEPPPQQVRCLFETLIGNATARVPPMKRHEIVGAFEGAFAAEADGGCAEVPCPSHDFPRISLSGGNSAPRVNPHSLSVQVPPCAPPCHPPQTRASLPRGRDSARNGLWSAAPSGRAADVAMWRELLSGSGGASFRSSEGQRESMHSSMI